MMFNLLPVASYTLTRSQHFDSYVGHACLHGRDRHSDMPFPGAGNDDAVEFLVVQHFFIFEFAAFVNFRFRDVELRDVLKCAVYGFLADIADGGDLVPRDCQNVVDVLLAA